MDSASRRSPFEALLHVPDAVVVSDENYSVVFWNQGAETLYGIAAEAALDKSIEALVDVVGSAIPREQIREIVEQSGSWRGEAQHRPVGGEAVWVDWSVSRCKLADGKTGFLSITRDITRQKLIEDAYREKTDRLQDITDHMFDLVSMTDLTGTFTYAGPSHRILGFEPDALIGTSVFEYVHPDDSEYIANEFAGALADPSPEMIRTVEYRQRCADGTYKWLETKGRFLFSDSGHPYAMFFSSRDITERKRIGEVLRENEARHRMVVDNIADVVIVVDLSMKPVFVSSSAERVFGYSVEETRELGPAGLMTPESLQKVMEIIAAQFVQGPEKEPQTVLAEVSIRRKDGFHIQCESHARFLRKADGTPYGVITLIRDITERKRAEEEVRKEREQMLSIFGSIDQMIYISDPHTYEILYVNPALTKLLQKDVVGGICYKELQGLDSPCDFCSNAIILEKSPEPYLWQHYNAELDRYFSIIDRIIQWPDGRNVRFEMAVDITEQKRAEERTLFDLQFRTLVAEASARLIESQDNDHLDHAVDIALSSFGQLFEVDRSYLFRFTEDMSLMDNTHEWCAPGVVPEKDKLQQIPSQHMAWWVAQLATLRPLHIPEVAALPEEAAEERALLQAQGIQSLICLPISDDRKNLIGFVGFDSVRMPHVWPQEQIDMLQVLAEIIGSAIVRMKTARTLADSEAFIRTVLDNLPIGVAVNYIDQGTATYVNRKFEEIYGWPREDLQDISNFFEKVYPDPAYRDVLQRRVMDDILSGDPKRMMWEDIKITKQSGEKGYISAKNIPLLEQNLMISTVQDITERNRAEDELRRYEWLLEKERPIHDESLSKYEPAYENPVNHNTARVILDAVGEDALSVMARDILALMDTCVAVYEANGDYAYGVFESAWCQLMDNASFGLCGTDDVKTALSCGKWLCHEDCWHRSAKAAIESGEPTDIECPGAIRLYAVPILAGNEIVGALNMGYSAPPRDQEALLALSEKYGVAVDDLRVRSHAYKPRPAFIIDTAKKLCHSMSKMIGESVERHRTKEERSRLEAQLQQAMKMEAVGRLAGGVAHDFNNLLTGITGNAEIMLMDLGSDDPLREMVEDIVEAADSAANLTRQLLAFSRKQLIEPKIVNLNDLVEKLHKMLVRLIGEDILLKTISSASLGSVKVDPGQFEQVLANLAVNARDAMPDGGTLIIETANVELDQAYCQLHPHVQPGRYVMLAVSDTGHGMTGEVKSRVFEPFFTTKPKGRGTGLGLATIFGVVKQSGGTIEVYSELNEGTAFKIYLPRLDQEAEALGGKPRALEMPGGSETVLVVEDEPGVRELAARILERLGYSVLQAPNGAQALALAEESEKPIDLLLTDVVMPGMNGRQLAERLRATHPETRVLYTSGYTENAIAHHGVIDEGLFFIGKPYTPQELARKIRDVLEEA